MDERLSNKTTKREKRKTKKSTCYDKKKDKEKK